MALFKKIKSNIVEEKEEKKKPKKEIKIKVDEKSEKKPSSDWLQSKGQLAADIYETDDAFCVQAPIAGVSQEDIEIFVENNMLIIKSERKEPESTKQKKYFYKECYWGPFSRQTILPEDVDTQKIKASFKKGLLLVSIPKTKTERKKIAIEIG